MTSRLKMRHLKRFFYGNRSPSDHITVTLRCVDVVEITCCELIHGVRTYSGIDANYQQRHQANSGQGG